jgi:hypothetical protein
VAAESAAHWLQGEDRDRGRDRSRRGKRFGGVSAAGRIFNSALIKHQEIQLIIRSASQIIINISILRPYK